MWIEVYNYLRAERLFFWPLLIGLPLCIGRILQFISVVKKKSEKGCGLFFLGLLPAFSLAWVISISCEIFPRYYQTKAMLENGQYQTVEGPVEQLTHPAAKIIYDHFMVNQVWFQVQSNDLSRVPASIDSSGHALANGRWVKVHYAPSSNIVLQMWMKQ